MARTPGLTVAPCWAGTSTQGEYVFAERNPFEGDPQALEKGKDLFRWGVLGCTTSCLHLPPCLLAHVSSGPASTFTSLPLMLVPVLPEGVGC
jgi:hypothetical protein